MEISIYYIKNVYKEYEDAFSRHLERMSVEIGTAEIFILQEILKNRPEERAMDVLTADFPMLHQKFVNAIKTSRSFRGGPMYYDGKLLYTYYLTSTEMRREPFAKKRFKRGVGMDMVDGPDPEQNILPYLYALYLHPTVNGGVMRAMMSQSPKKRKAANDIFAIINDYSLNDNQKKIKLLKEKGVEAIELLCRLWEVADDKTRERALKKNVLTPRTLGKEPLYGIRVQSYNQNEEHEKVDGFYKIELYSEELEDTIELKFSRKRAKVLYLWYLSHPNETFKKSALNAHKKEWTHISNACYKEVFNPDKDWPQNRGDANRAVRTALGNHQDFSYWYEISQEGRLDKYFLGRMCPGLIIKMDSFLCPKEPNSV